MRQRTRDRVAADDPVRSSSPEPDRRRRLQTWIGVAARAACLILALGVISTVLLYPPAAALACPQCYGFESARQNVYVEALASAAEKCRALAAIDAGREQVSRFFGSQIREPRILICVHQACYQKIGSGSSSGMALSDVGLFLSPRGATEVIAVHELSHIALHVRLGWVKTARRAIPQWFDEGLAVVVSNDPRYLAPPSAADRCLIFSTEALPTGRGEWIENAASRDLYAKAACRVWRWLESHQGSAGALRLIERVSRGEDFDHVLNENPGS